MALWPYGLRKKTVNFRRGQTPNLGLTAPILWRAVGGSSNFVVNRDHPENAARDSGRPWARRAGDGAVKLWVAG